MTVLKEKIILSGLFVLGIVLLILDISDDLKHGSEMSHIIEEALIVLISLVGVGILWLRFYLARVEKIKVQKNLETVKKDLDSFRQETQSLFRDINTKIDSQFEGWKLTEAEKEVALLALKGMSTKDISSARSTSEKTVNQQLGNIYQKSGLHGRQELTAFFLEDLFDRTN